MYNEKSTEFILCLYLFQAERKKEYESMAFVKIGLSARTVEYTDCISVER